MVSHQCRHGAEVKSNYSVALLPWLISSMCLSTHLQLEELSLLLTRLRRHQAELASVRNFAVGQLLQHHLTFPTCQVSAGGLSQGRGHPRGKGMTCWPALPRARALLCTYCPALSLLPCLFASGCYCQTLCSGGRVRAPGTGEEAACGVRDLNCGFSGCE